MTSWFKLYDNGIRFHTCRYQCFKGANQTCFTENEKTTFIVGVSKPGSLRICIWIFTSLGHPRVWMLHGLFTWNGHNYIYKFLVMGTLGCGCRVLWHWCLLCLLGLGPYLVVITDRTLVGEINGHLIWMITKTEFYPYARSLFHMNNRQVRAIFYLIASNYDLWQVVTPAVVPSWKSEIAWKFKPNIVFKNSNP